MPGQPAFRPAYEALVSLGRTATTREVGAMINRTPETVSNSFGAHIKACRESNSVPAVIRVQNGVYAINVEKAPANPKWEHNSHGPEKVKAVPMLSKATNSIFEHFHTTKSGTMLVRGEDGTVYKLEELDF